MLNRLFTVKYIQPRNYTCKIFGLILIFVVVYFVLKSLCQQVSLAQCLAHQTVDAQVAGSNLCRIFLVTPRCLLVQYSVYPLVINNGLWLNGLSCLFLLQIYWPIMKVIGSNPAKGSRSSPIILSIQIRSYPTPHMDVQLPHLGKKCCTT